MSLVKHYILDVYNVRECQEDWGKFIEVDLLYDCYGSIKRVKETFSTREEWERAKRKGYYLA